MFQNKAEKIQNAEQFLRMFAMMMDDETFSSDHLKDNPMALLLFYRFSSHASEINARLLNRYVSQ